MKEGIYIIRHITTKSLFEKIKQSGYITPAGSGSGRSAAPEINYIAFETYKGNKAFYEAIYNGKKSVLFEELQKSDLVGLILDENELADSGYKIVFATSKYPEQYTIIINGETFTTKWENYPASIHGVLTQFDNIGEYVFIEGRIPVHFIKEVEEWIKN